MKLFAFIMALLVLTLSCMPCADEGYANGQDKTALSTAANDNCDDHADDCSPFCTCNCCAGFTINTASFQMDGCVSSSAIRNAKQLPNNISAISLPIWQPPRLG